MQSFQMIVNLVTFMRGWTNKMHAMHLMFLVPSGCGRYHWQDRKPQIATKMPKRRGIRFRKAKRKQG